MRNQKICKVLLLLFAFPFMLFPLAALAAGGNSSADAQALIEENLKRYDRSSAYDLIETRSIDPMKEPEAFMRSLSQKIWIARHYELTDDIVKTAIQLLEIATDQRNNKYQMEAMDALAYVDYFNFNNDLALKKWNTVATLAVRENMQEELYRYYRGLGLLAIDNKQYDAATSYFRKAISIAEENNCTGEDGSNVSAILHTDLNALYFKFADYKNAAQIDETALVLIPLQDTESRFDIYLRLADDYHMGGDVQMAKHYLSKAMELKDHVSDRQLHTSVAKNMINLEAAIAYLDGDMKKTAELFYGKYMKDRADQNYIDVYIDTQNFASSYETSNIENELNLLTQLQEEQAGKMMVQKYLLVLSILALLLLAALLVAKVTALKKQRAQKEILFQLSTTDQLTQLKNRRRIIEELDSMLPGSRSIALLDIDKFKLVNDTYGHATGDLVLKRIAETLRSSVRENDEVGRYGGEEFLILLDTDDIEIAKEIAERVRSNVEQLEWGIEGLKTTISIGLVYSKQKTSDELLVEADLLLYESKNTGRNKLIAMQV